MIPTSCYVHFYQSKSSGIVCRLFIGAFRKQFLKPFELDQPEAFLLPSSELNGTSPDAILSCSFSRFFLSFYIFRWTKFRLFSVSNINTYSDTEISIISLRFGGLELTLLCFSPLFTRFSLCLHIMFLSLTVGRGGCS